MQKTKLKSIMVTICVIGYLGVNMLTPVFASISFSSKEHSHYAPKKCDYAADETVTNDVVDGISFYITKINNANDKSSSYKRIRAYLVGNSDTVWIGTSAWGPSIASGSGNAVHIIMQKGRYYEIFTGNTANNNVTISYYGNDSTKAAYVYIREGVNEAVSTD